MVSKSSESLGLNAWFTTDLGNSLRSAEADCLKQLLPELYGPVAVQFGESELFPYIDSTDSALRVTAAYPRGEHRGESSSLRCYPEAMPFEHKSIGLCLLAHVLEFSEHPHQILREVDRVLVPEGHVVIVGFNPLSFWGLLGLFSRQSPWNGHFRTLSRIKDWLALLNFECRSGTMLYYRPPFRSAKIQQKLEFMEKMGQRWWPLIAAVYVLVARKREIGMTPIIPKWKKRPRLAGVAEPVARVVNQKHSKT